VVERDGGVAITAITMREDILGPARRAGDLPKASVAECEVKPMEMGA
jgi:hypothetical protein